MTSPGDTSAWLERQDGTTVAVQGACSIGRAETNQVVLADGKASRKHAVIHRQGESEYWLVDLGSSNGTYLNGRRVPQPVALSDGATIQIGNSTLRFRRASAPSDDGAGHVTISQPTLVDIRTVPCWLLLADIADSTGLSNRVPAEQLPMIIGRWFAETKQVVEAHGGAINKYLGDGFFAYWPSTAATIPRLASAIQGLKELQAVGTPRFRLVVHHGQVLMGGGPSLGEESLSGSDVNFIFRMEKLAGGLAQPCLMSETAAAGLVGHVPATAVGSHPLSGFPGTYPFLSF